MKSLILGTGLSGLVGTRIVELLSSQYEFEDLSLDTGCDITDVEQIFTKFKASQAKLVLHLAAKTDVDGCEADKPLGKDGAAWKINAQATGNIVEAAKTTGKRVIYISTDFVFDGTKDVYTENDTPNPINWYATTKYAGEKYVLAVSGNTVARISYPYRARCPSKKDFIHALLVRLQNNQTVAVLEDHIFTPTLIDDIAAGLQTLTEKVTSGIYHLSGSESLTPMSAAQKLVQILGLDQKLLMPTTIARYFQDRAARPYKLALENAKIRQLGVRMHTFSDGLTEIKKQGTK